MRRRHRSSSPSPAAEVGEHDADWVTSWSVRQCSRISRPGRLRQVVATFSDLHLVCFAVLVLALTDVAITALPPVTRALSVGMSTRSRAKNLRTETCAELRYGIASKTRMGDLRSAIELATMLVACLQSELNAGNWTVEMQVLDALDTLAGLYHRQGDLARAESLYLRHLEILQATRVPASWAGIGVPELLCTLAELRALQGDESRAEALVMRALRMCEDYSPDHHFTGQVRAELASLRCMKDEDAVAEAPETLPRTQPDGRVDNGPDDQPGH